jgi:hypothetical protein
MTLAEKYMPLAEAMASKYPWDEEALARAYFGMMVGINRLPDDHPNPGGFIAGYIKNKLILKPLRLMVSSLTHDPGYDPGDPPNYLIEDITYTKLEEAVALGLYQGYSTREIALMEGVSHHRVWEIRKLLKERLQHVLGT